jgi:hypothetical protein
MNWPSTDRLALTVLLMFLTGGIGEPTVLAGTAADQAYREVFEKKHPRVDPVPSLAHYASAKRYDQLYLGEEFDDALATMSNKGGGMAWGWSYRMVSLNEMARATGEAKYLAANLRVIRRALEVRDDRTGLKLFDGRVLPAWSSDGYRKGEQALFTVHTGMIAHPMLDAVHLGRTMSDVPDEVRRGLDETVTATLQSLGCHDDAWRDGPGEGEGHYVMLNEEPSSEGKPQPGNRLSAMGRALYAAYRVTKDEKYLIRTRALARYIERRLQVTESNAYIWPYWLPVDPVTPGQPLTNKPEDTSHGSLTMAFPLMLAEDGEVFTAQHMKRFGRTVTQGMGRLGDGVLLGDVGGLPSSSPAMLGVPTIWLQLAPYAPEVREPIIQFYLRHVPKPRHIDIAYLIRFGAAK